MKTDGRSGRPPYATWRCRRDGSRSRPAWPGPPGPVQVIVGVEAGLGDDPQAYVRRVVSALESQSRRFGAYPWPQYSLALTPDLKGGIEYPMHVMQGPN